MNMRDSAETHWGISLSGLKINYKLYSNHKDKLYHFIIGFYNFFYPRITSVDYS